MIESKTYGALGGREHLTPAEITDEFSGQEIFSKLKCPQKIGIGDTVGGLCRFFQKPDMQFSAMADSPDRFSETVIKFHAGADSITLTHHPVSDTWIFKRKGQKQIFDGSVVCRSETKLIIPSDMNIYRFAENQIGEKQSWRDYSGAYVRFKNQFNLINRFTGRIYKINGDLIIPTGGFPLDLADENRRFTEYPEIKLNQIEIKYRGIGTSASPDPDAINAVISDIIALQKLVISASGVQGIILKPTLQSKNKWLRSVTLPYIHPDYGIQYPNGNRKRNTGYETG
jgi:hypothetical protein